MLDRMITYRCVLFIHAITHDTIVCPELLLSCSTGTWGSSEGMGEAMVKKASIACVRVRAKEEVIEGAEDDVV